MSDSPNNPVIQRPKTSISQTARKGIMSAMQLMAGMVQTQGRRVGKHHGRTKGAFGKQR